MRARNLIHSLFAMFFAAVFCFLAPMAEAATPDAPTFVREVTLSKGNWLWHHHKRMSVSYQNAHTFTAFMETEACFLVDRKCTENDWRHVPRTQKIYVPTENVLLKLGANDRVPVLGLSLAAKGRGLYSLSVQTLPLTQDQETALNDRIKNLEFINRDLRSQYSALAVVYQYLVVISMLVICGVFVLIFVMWRTYRRKNEEIADLKDDLEDERSMSRVPILTDIVPQGKSPPLVPLLPRISAVEVTNETPFPTSKELVFKEFDEEHGSGFAEDEAHKHVYLISRHTKGFHGQLKRDEHFLALVVYPNFVEQILEK